MTTTPTDPSTLGDIQGTVDEIQRLRRHLLGLVNLFSEEDYTKEDVAELMFAINVLKADIAEAYAEVEEFAVKALPYGVEIELPSGARIERRSGSQRKKWDHKGLTEIVSERIVNQSIDFDTGEINRTMPEMVRAIMQYAAPSYWRVTQLRDLGVDPDKFCEKEDPKPSVIVRRPQQ